MKIGEGLLMKRLIMCVVATLVVSLGATTVMALPSFKEVRSKVTENPNDLKARFLLGKYYLKMREYNNALREWKYIVKKRPKLWKIYNRIGLVRYKMGAAEDSYDRKKACWSKALRIWNYVRKNNRNDKWANKAYFKVRAKLALLIKKGKGSGGGRPKIVAPKPVKPKPGLFGPDHREMSSSQLDEMYGKAYSSFCNEKFMDAAPMFACLSRSKIKTQDSLFYLGNCFLKEAEEPDKAIKYFQDYKQKYGEDARVLFAMGSAYGLSGQFQKQIDCFERSLQFEPDDPETHFQLALAYDKVDKPNKTVEHAQRAVQLDAGFKKRLQPLIKNSKVARRIGNIITDVLRETETSQLSDEQIDEYARRVGEILGEENINPEGNKGDYRSRFKKFMGSGQNRDNLRKMMSGDGTADDLKKMANDAGISRSDVEGAANKFKRRRRR